MHSGHYKINTKSFLRKGVLIIFAAALFACNREAGINSIYFATPGQGDNYNAGAEIHLKLNIPEEMTVTSVQYLIDHKLIAARKNGDSVTIPTRDLPLGYRLLTAIVKHNDLSDTIQTNIVLKAAHAPASLKYQVVASFPHQTNAYTEGLSFVDGKLLESTGEKGASALKYVDLKSGKDLQQITLPSQYFGEGSVKVGNKIIMLTWQENQGFIFDAATFRQLGTFPYQNSREGWGLTFDGKRLLRTDGTNRVWFMNAQTYQEEGYLEVYDQNGQVNNLNELEYIDGKIYANVYLTSKIVRIDPHTGAVEAELDLAALVPKNYFKTDDEIQNNVLNGIAYDKKSNRIFVTGKKWPKLYEIRLIP